MRLKAALRPAAAPPCDASLRCRDQFVVLAARRTDVNDDLIANLDLRDLDGQPAKPPSQANLFGVFRLKSLPEAAARC